MMALLFVVRTLLDLYILTYVVRFILQLTRADFHNPLSQFIIRVTDPLVRPLRRVVPGLRGMDLATLVAVLLLQALTIVILASLVGLGIPNPASFAFFLVVRTVVTVLRLYFFAILIWVILSWVNPGAYNPATALLASITRPVLAPVRRLIPPIGGLDLSPLFVIIGLQAVQMVLMQWLPRWLW